MLALGGALPPLLPPSMLDGPSPLCRSNMAALHGMLGRGCKPRARHCKARCPLSRVQPLAQRCKWPQQCINSVACTETCSRLCKQSYDYSFINSVYDAVKASHIYFRGVHELHGFTSGSFTPKLVSSLKKRPASSLSSALNIPVFVLWVITPAPHASC